jgi:hypothetical protein
MALTSAELQEMADLSNELGDEQGELEALTQLESTGALGGAQQPDFPGAAIIEPARAIASGVAHQIGGGIAGIAGALTPGLPEGAGADIARQTQAGAFQPQTAAGKAGLETLGDLVQRGVDIVNIPLSGIGAILELVSGQGIDQAVETIKSVQSRGVSKAAGLRTLEETGSPLAATAVETALAGGGELLALKGAGGAAVGAAQRGAAATGRAVTPAIQAGRELATTGRQLATEIFQRQSPTKQRIARLLKEGSRDVARAGVTDVETAGFRLAAPGQKAPAQPTRLQEFLNVGGPRVEAVPAAQEAIKQGFDRGVIAPIQAATAADKTKMLKMVQIMERGKANKLFAAKNRPSDVAGDSLLDRVKSIRTANKSAGKDIDRIANGLRGQQVDLLEAVTGFGETLDNLGVQLASNGKGGFTPNFELSQLSPGDRGPIKEVIRQMNIRGAGGIDAFDAHKMKRIIDNNVTFGKVKTGISGDAERALKGFRTDLDNALDTQFPDYNAANVKYSETIGALDSIQDVAGRKMDLSGGNADKALGTLLRRTLSNAESRIRLIDSIDEIESVAKKHGGTGQPRIEGASLGQDDLLTQVLFVDELDAVFGPVARTSFQGQIDQALKQGVSAATTQAGAVDVAVGAAGKVAEKARGINEAGAFKAIKELLKGQQ